MTLTELRALRDLINTSVDCITEEYEASGHEFPSLDSFPYDSKSSIPDVLRKKPEVDRAISVIIAAAAQLTAAVQEPRQFLIDALLIHNFPSALGVVEAGNIAEILREAGPEGMHIKELARRSNMHEKKLGVVMLYLATKHIFREVAPDTYTNNSISLVLDSGKVADGDLSPMSKLETSQGMAGAIAFNTNVISKYSVYLVNAMTHPESKYSEEANESAFQLANKTHLGFFEHLDLPENELARKQFAKMMSGFITKEPKETIVEGESRSLDWGSLKPGSLVCDVGGGLGHVSLIIARAHPHLKFTIEDKPDTVRDARPFWIEHYPSAVESERVQFIGVDFLEAQPPFAKAPDVFILSLVLHNWPDKYAIIILRHLRTVASKDTRLVVIEAIVEHTCNAKSVGSKNPHILPPPKPLLRNWGQANVNVYDIDMTMVGTFNSRERTKEDFEEIFATSGWKLEEIRYMSSDLNLRPSIIAAPIDAA